MEANEFLEAVTHRLADYVASKDRRERVNPDMPPASLRRTLDVQLPIEGQGLNPVLDDLDNREVRASVKEKVLALCAKYPVYQQA